MSAPEIAMQRVSSKYFWEHLDRWSMVATISRPMPVENEGGRYAQTGYFSVAEVRGTTLVPDETNLLAVVRKSPTKSEGKRDMGYFINLNARPEDLS